MLSGVKPEEGENKENRWVAAPGKEGLARLSSSRCGCFWSLLRLCNYRCIAHRDTQVLHRLEASNFFIAVDVSLLWIFTLYAVRQQPR